MAINTLNESNLHKKLKEIYALQEGSRTEVEADGKIYDVITEDETIVEIQTRNLSKLLPKVLKALENKRNIKIVYPVVREKIIKTLKADGTLISSRKSPKKENLYSVFKELTGLYPTLLLPGFTLEVLEVSITEIRLQTEENVQSKNKRRKFEKNWIKQDKLLNEIYKKNIFKTKEDYLALLPETLVPKDCLANERKTKSREENPDCQYFSRTDISNFLKQNKETRQNAYKNASLFIWVLEKMELIEYTGKEGRKKLYRVI